MTTPTPTTSAPTGKASSSLVVSLLLIALPLVVYFLITFAMHAAWVEPRCAAECEARHATCAKVISASTDGPKFECSDGTKLPQKATYVQSGAGIAGALLTGAIATWLRKRRSAK